MTATAEFVHALHEQAVRLRDTPERTRVHTERLRHAARLGELAALRAENAALQAQVRAYHRLMWDRFRRRQAGRFKGEL